MYIGRDVDFLNIVKEDESFGIVEILWRLTEELRRDSYKMMAHGAMMMYLSSGVTSPMQKVETWM